MDGSVLGKGLGCLMKLQHTFLLAAVCGPGQYLTYGLCSLLGQKHEDEEGRVIRQPEDVMRSQEVPAEKYQSSGTLIPPSKTLIF